MRLDTSIPALFAISTLFSSGSSLPFFARRVNLLEPLVRRATYSVVPVDGGPAAATGADGVGSNGKTIIETVTAAPATKTIVETPPATTDYILSTTTVHGSPTVQTIVVTISPSPATITKTSYSVIDVNSPPVTIVVSAQAQSSSSLSTTQSQIRGPASSGASSSVVQTSYASSFAGAVPSGSAALSSSSIASSTVPSSSISTTASGSYSATFVTYASISSLSTTSSTIFSSTSTSSTTSSSTTSSYDNGQWHTYYPAWNATTTSAPVKGRSVEKKGPLMRGLKKAVAPQ